MLKEAFEIHQELNPKIWTSDNSLKDDVRTKILDIVDTFKDFCDINFEILDIHLLGSNASYNWTNKSDLDIHIIVNFELISNAEELIQIIFNLEKASFNKKYDITIYDIPAEIYVEDVNANTVSNGIYSVMNNKWIKEPIPITKVDEKDISSLLSKWKYIIDLSIEKADSDRITDLLNAIYLVRKNALIVDGEYSAGNNLFKTLRNDGYLDKLKDALIDIKTKELSLEELHR